MGVILLISRILEFSRYMFLRFSWNIYSMNTKVLVSHNIYIDCWRLFLTFDQVFWYFWLYSCIFWSWGNDYAHTLSYDFESLCIFMGPPLPWGISFNRSCLVTWYFCHSLFWCSLVVWLSGPPIFLVTGIVSYIIFSLYLFWKGDFIL